MMEKISENHKERSRTVKERTKGRVTIPTDLDVVPETLELLERWGADAIRDCDGTDYPEELKNADAKVYSTYYTTHILYYVNLGYPRDNQKRISKCLQTLETPYVSGVFHFSGNIVECRETG